MWNKIKIFLVALLGTLAFSTPALAGPAVIVGAVIGGAIGAGAAALGLIAGSVFVAGAIGAAVGAAAGALMPSMMGGVFDTPDYNVANNAQAENEGILVNKTGTLENIPVVYGQRKVGGKIVFLDTSGDRNKYLYMALVLSEGEIEAIDDIYINDIISTDARFRDRFEYEKFLGGDNQIAGSLLQQTDSWTAAHRLQGVAYLAVRFEWKKIEDQDDADANPYSGIPKVQCVIRGKKVASAATAGAVTYENETVAFSNNPADCLLDYLRNPRYGRGLSNDRINFSSFSTARSKYATQVNYAAGGQGPILSCDAVIDTSRSLLDNTKLFLSNMRSGMPYIQGEFKLKLQDTGHDTDSQNTTPNSVYTVTNNNIVNGIKLMANGTREHFNQIKLTYVDPTNEWKTNEVIYPTLNGVLDTQYLQEDNGRRLTKEISMNHIINTSMAADLAHIILTQSRKRKHINFTATSELHEAEVGDIITVDYAPLGINSIYYRITSMQINADYTIDITASEHEPSNYVFSDRATITGGPHQIAYVGNAIQSVSYQRLAYSIGGGLLGAYYGIVKGIFGPNASVPKLPSNFGASWAAGLAVASYLNVNSVSQVALFDRPGFAYETIRFNLLIQNMVIDAMKSLNLQKRNTITGLFEDVLSVNPTILQRSGSDYLVDYNSELDGLTHDFRLYAIMDNGDKLPSAIFQHTSPTSIYVTKTGGTF